MARRVKDQNLDSKDARRKLKARGKPYYRTIERGLHVGYRKLKAAAGTWVARYYVGEQSYKVEAIGEADDIGDADGVKLLDFWQAQEKARKRMVERAHAGTGKMRPLTVGAAMGAYIEWLETNRKSASDARYRADAFILPEFGKLEVSALTADKIRKWLVAMTKEAPRLRTGKGGEQQHAPLGRDGESKRKRQATANRTLTVFKAALNRARRDGKVVLSNAAWDLVEPFENVNAARVRYLSVAEAKRLVNACDPDFRRMVQAALETGARYGELAALEVGDFNADSGTVAIRQSKAGKARHVVVTEEGVAFFRQLCAGRAARETLLVKANGSPWQKSHQKRPMADACERAKITPMGIHGLRHTWASLSVMAGVPLMVVARNLGHADTRMVEKHYGHLAPSYIADAIRAGAPRFGFKPDAKVTPLGA
jgi:integrase